MNEIRRLDELKTGDKFIRIYGLQKHGTYTVLSDRREGIGTAVKMECGRVGHLYCWELVRKVD